MPRQLASKLLKTEALLRSAEVAAHIPETSEYSATNLRFMLDRYQMVFIKPVRGGGGSGVIRVLRTAEGYAFNRMERTHRFKDFEKMITKLEAVKLKRPYLIQQGIRLATIGSRPVDYRLKMVKNGDLWELRALVGRVAKPGLVVTNLCKGGMMLQGRDALKRSLGAKAVSPKRKEMRALTALCISILEEQFPGIGELGFDYGIDRDKRIWLLEVNTRPQ
ncbi:YheC/YheD family protein [Paenibacillus massiliensis]|uniref:YheC/YheD family protein n=1 Tax=Paenibacillus massiliensis TaxID=225917 RepID=UPI000472D5AF|nr:YheC/YheD family protein [Paenibacillus massiliensis]